MSAIPSAAAGGDAGAPSQVIGGVTIDRSSPEALIRTFRDAARKWEIEAVVACFNVEGQAANELAEELEREKDEIVACMTNAELEATMPMKKLDELRFSLRGCPSKKGFTGRLVWRAGGWRIAEM